MKWPKAVNELPNEPTFVIIEFESITYDDPYERPGSGQSCTTHYPNIITFDTEQEWLDEIRMRTDSTRPHFRKKEFRAYKMMPTEITLSVNVEVKQWKN